MRRRWILDFFTALSLVLLTATASWVVGLVRARHATVWRVRARPERTTFVRVDRQHLVVSIHSMVPVGMPAAYRMDTTHFPSYQVFGPDMPQGGGVTMSDESPILTPEGAWFRNIRTPIGGVQYGDSKGGIAWQARGFYQAIDVPWWSLIVLFSLLPGAQWVARRRRRAKGRRGLCPECGYDLRATPERCPECGAARIRGCA